MTGYDFDIHVARARFDLRFVWMLQVCELHGNLASYIEKFNGIKLGKLRDDIVLFYFFRGQNLGKYNLRKFNITRSFPTAK